MTDDKNEDQRVSMWELSGREARKIIATEGKNLSDFCRFIGKSRYTVEQHQFVKMRVNSWYRDRVVDYVGEVAYFRRLIALRRDQNRPTEEMVKHYDMLTTHKRVPIAARETSRM